MRRTSVQIRDLEQFSVKKTLNSEGFPQTFLSGPTEYIYLNTFVDGDVRIFSPHGRLLREISLPTPLHPLQVLGSIQKGYLLILASIDPFSEFKKLQVKEIKTEWKESYFLCHVDPNDQVELLLEISNAEIQTDRCLSLSKEENLYFFRYIDTNQQYRLTAIGPGLGGAFEVLYTCSIPEDLYFAADKDQKNVIYTFQRLDPLKFGVLGKNPPSFPQERGPQKPKVNLPEIEAKMVWSCHSINGLQQERINQYENHMNSLSPSNLQSWLPESQQNITNPTSLIAIHKALYYHTKKQPETENLLEKFQTWLAANHDRDPEIALELANAFSTKNQWKTVIALLETIPLEIVPKPKLCHFCHLPGIARYREGQFLGAQEIWSLGLQNQEFHQAVSCNIEPLVDLVTYQHRHAAPKVSESTQALWDTLKTIEDIDLNLTSQEWSKALVLISSLDATWRKETQIIARAAWAHLNLDPTESGSGTCLQAMEKRLYLDQIVEMVQMSDLVHGVPVGSTEKTKSGFLQVLPPPLENWVGDRLRNLADQAAQWLKS